MTFEHINKDFILGKFNTPEGISKQKEYYNLYENVLKYRNVLEWFSVT